MGREKIYNSGWGGVGEGGVDTERVPGGRYIHEIHDWRYDKRGGDGGET